MADDGDDYDPQKFFQRNQAWVKPGDHVYNTPLNTTQEHNFRVWLHQNNVPFDPEAKVTDYDMRGFWAALNAGDPIAKSAIDPNDSRMHYPDYWKTPYHETFSNESQWADPNRAPKWNDQDQLVMPGGSILYDDRASNMQKLMQAQQGQGALIKSLPTTKGP